MATGEAAAITVRRTICYVPQQPILFSGTIRENLLYGNRSAFASEIDSAIEAAQLLCGLYPCLYEMDELSDARHPRHKHRQPGRAAFRCLSENRGPNRI